MNVFNMEFTDIPLEDIDSNCKIIVCLDGKNRLGKKTWVVIRHFSDEGFGDALGLFWDRERAIEFAKIQSGALCLKCHCYIIDNNNKWARR